MHSWKHCLDRSLKTKLRRAKILVFTSDDFRIKHPNEVRAAAKKDFTEQIIRVKKEHEKYLHAQVVPTVERPKRMNRVVG